MTAFILFFALFVAATAADTYTTHAIVKGGGVELNTFLYGSKPTLARLALVDVAFGAAFLALGIIALHYHDVIAACTVLVISAALHLFGAIHNAWQLRK